MIERNAELIAFRDRIREKCGQKDFVTVMDVSRACGIGRDTCYTILKRLPRVGGKLYLDDAAETLYIVVRPKSKRCG